MTETVKYVIFKTKWGYFGLAANIRGLLRTSLPCPDRNITQNYLLAGLSKPEFDKNLLKPLQEKIVAYFEGRAVKFNGDIPLAVGNPGSFMNKVLVRCAKIPYGKAISYSQLARLVGKPLAARAVGNALAKNPVPLLIPCHRVIHASHKGRLTADGSVGNFSAFLDAKPGSPITAGKSLKLKLLQLERAI
jgi:methylated-DNA-[protein]-cysteine S-methyltransferase